MKKLVVCVMSVLIVSCMVGRAPGQEYTIYEIQYDRDANGTSLLAGNDVNCAGGILVDKFIRSKAKLTLIDPVVTNQEDPNGWRGIFVKTEFDFDPNVFDSLSIGDWVSFENVLVKDGDPSQHNTQLEYGSPSSFVIVSSGNVIPEPIVVSPNELTAPVYDSGPPVSWLVTSDKSEKYEAMLVTVENVVVDSNSYGPKGDVYALQDGDNEDPNYRCWVSDYMNDDATGNYHSFVTIGREFCSVTGIIEQYKGEKYGKDWDFYQLLTTGTGDLKRYTPADLTGDCKVNLEDLSEFSNYWLWGTE